ncbi:glycosyltransferase family 2 protein [Meredithblackwellia eburnea MCA 4105]
MDNSVDETRNLVQLVQTGDSNHGAVFIPAADSLAQTLTARYRKDLTATYVGDSNLVVLNPFEVLSDVSNASKAEYEDRAYALREGKGGEDVQPHAYDLACRVYLLMNRTKQTQSVVFSGLSGAGSSSQRQLFTSQVLRLSTSSKKDQKLAQQVLALDTLLTSFGSAKTHLNPSASRHTTFLELHFSEAGRLAGAKVLAFGLDKSRVAKLARDERTFNCFYQLLAGATVEERRELALLDDLTSYALLQSSGCFRLPHGPGSDDSIAFEDLRASLKVLGFKPRHVSSIFRLLSAILLLGNIEFDDLPNSQSRDPAYVVNRDVLASAAQLLGLQPEDLERGLTNRVRWVRKEMTALILTSEGATAQRDELMSSLYSILFAFVVETANHKVFPGDEAILDLQAQGGSSIILLDTPGFHTRTPDRRGSGVLVSALNGFDEFTNNYANEVVQAWLAEHEFDGDSGVAARAQEDGVRLADVIPPDQTSRLELLRGGRVGGKADRKPGGIFGGLSKTCSGVRKGSPLEEADAQLLSGMREHFTAHPAFVANAPGPGVQTAFSIAHFAGTVTYDVRGMIEKNLDALDAEFVALFRGSEDGFISKLFSGPSLAAEVHPLDENTIVSAQVSSQPLRRPSPIKPCSGAAPLAEGVDPTEPLLDPLEIHPVSTQLNASLSLLLNLLDRTRVWSLIALRPNDARCPRTVDARRLRQQVSAYLIPELVARKKVEFIHDCSYETFAQRHGLADPSPTGAQDFLTSLGLGHMADFAIGTSSVWLSYRAWKLVEDRLRAAEPPDHRAVAAKLAQESTPNEKSTPTFEAVGGHGGLPSGFASSRGSMGGNDWGAGDLSSPGLAGGESVDDLLLTRQTSHGEGGDSGYYAQDTQPFRGGHRYGFSDSLSTPAPYIQQSSAQSDVWGPEKEAATQFAAPRAGAKEGVIDSNGNPLEKGAMVEEVPTSRGRRFWVALVWACTWWIPSVCLRYLGRMKRPDVRLAWREKVTLCMLIFFFCALVIFYIIGFGKILCPEYDKAWNAKEVSYHAGTSDYWVSVRGKVYDLTHFYKIQHSDITGESVTSELMMDLVGEDLSPYFPVPLTLACPTLVTDNTLSLQYLNFTADVPTAIHTSGSQQASTGSELYNNDWYTSIFLPKMQNYYKGPLVVAPKKLKSEADSAGRYWATYQGKIYDLTDYFNTIDIYSTNSAYQFLNSDLANLFQAQAGTDITSAVKELNLDDSTLETQMSCISTLFYSGEPDFRLSARCQLQPNLLLAFTCIICATIASKFLAALQLGSKKNPEMRDKFVICQVPCYTEGEESLRKTIDSLATLQYDDKRKLLLIICDGMIIGSGNDRPTPRIVLDIFGVDQSIDPDPLMFKSISEGSKQLNYGKVWSGLYEVDGHVVPYLVVAKVGRPSERSRPGNRGKRDSQILAMRFLNRVHFDSEMYPLELEMYHQVKNVIGVDPQLYEYMLVIDADTSVAADSLNRLVSAAADDSRIIGICGETKLQNEKESWWTMIQVYEYYISHHMAKAFESLFGTVTCLPGCFTMYRLRSADKGKPLLVSSLIIDEYSESNLDTLHKKNLLALGEDRYLTTLILKHFPNYKTKFTPDAQAMTVAPDRWTVLISQRRRWINSTVHNLAELMFLPDMCGFCCIGMRFVVVLDLVGTMILPATFVYLIYMIVTVATGSSAIPVVSLALLAATYGLQAIIFLIKRQWQFIGWLVIYLLAYPVYSFLLPLYSFWRFDDFTWGSTRVVVGEGKSKKILQHEDEAFDESSIPMKKFADYQAALLDDDAHSVRSHAKTESVAGFSMATKMPPGSYAGGADYYRDTKHSRAPSRATVNQFPSMPSMPYMTGGGPGSIVGGGSEFGYGGGFQMPAGHRGSQMTLGSMMPPASMGFGRRESSMSAFTGYGLPQATSTYSVNPFMNPAPSPTATDISENANPTDQELVGALKAYLANTDLMSVTKRSAREKLASLFPRADLTARRDSINKMIDSILAGQL